jgi:hypothetical protein
LESICHAAGFANHKRVLTIYYLLFLQEQIKDIIISEGNRHADLEIHNISVAQQTDLPCAIISSAPVTELDRIKASSATLTTRTKSSRAPLPQDPQLSRHISPQPACGFLAGVHVYLGPHPRRSLTLDLLPIQQTSRRQFCGPWLSAAQTRLLSPSRCVLPAKPGHHRYM